MRSIFAATLLGATLASAALTVPAAAQERTISVTGQGNISVDPDMATVVIAVQSDAEKSADALDQASAATAAILATLDGEGIEGEHIRSGAIRLQPMYNQSVLSSGQQISGYRALNSIEIDVMALDRLGGLLSAMIGEGANRLDRVSFGLQDPSEAMDDARRRAIAEGARLAVLYASAAGVSVGDLMMLNENGSNGYRPVMAQARGLEMAASSPQFDVPVAPGKIELSASILMVYAIAD